MDPVVILESFEEGLGAELQKGAKSAKKTVRFCKQVRMKEDQCEKTMKPQEVEIEVVIISDMLV